MLQTLRQSSLVHARHICTSITTAAKFCLDEPPINEKNFAQRLAVAKFVQRARPPIDIGFQPKRCARSVRLRRFATQQSASVCLDQVEREWLSGMPVQARAIARHYGVYRHMFGRGEFLPVVPLRVEYSVASGEFDNNNSNESSGSDDLCHVVARGNVIKPAEASRTPAVSFRWKSGEEVDGDGSSAGEKTMWTLTCTSLEGGVEHDSPESLLWMVQNIVGQGGDVTVSDPDSCIVSGTEVFPYRQPLPSRGTGFHRVAFVLYKHSQADLCVEAGSNVSGHNGPGPAPFSSEQFYRANEQTLTPASLVFFQSDWDASVQRFWHERFKRAEPVFEYVFPPPYVAKQPWFPAGQSVHHFFDKHADPRDIQHQMLVKRLASVHPFRGETRRYSYPVAAIPKRSALNPTWRRDEHLKEARRVGKYYFIDRRVSQLFNPHC